MTSRRAPEPAEVERLAARFLECFEAHERWGDSPEPSPHEPAEYVLALGRQGALARPFLVSLARSDRPGLRWWSVVGLEALEDALGAEGLDALEGLLDDPRCGRSAFGVLLRRAPERFWSRRWYERAAFLPDAAALAQSRGAGGDFLRRLLAMDDDERLTAALGGVALRSAADPALLVSLQEVQRSALPRARAKAAALLATVPGACPVEALIEAAVLSGDAEPPLLERVAWHPLGATLAEALAQHGRLGALSELLLRRRAAGQPAPVTPLLPTLARALASADTRADAARCARELADEALLPSLVAAVPAVAGEPAADDIIDALASFGAQGRSALRAAHAGPGGDPALARALVSLEAVREPTLEEADAAFREGRIDHGPGSAFWACARVLRRVPSAHAAFQLAWIDRAFGVPITSGRIEWIRSLGFDDAPFLELLGAPAPALWGARAWWARTRPEEVEGPSAAGLPGLAFRNTRAPRFAEAARAHLLRVQRACGRLRALARPAAGNT